MVEALAFAGGVVRWGPLRISAYGLCSAVGLLAALWLSSRTARQVGIEAINLWDAGVFGLGAAFVISRGLLVTQNWAAFRLYPIAVLGLPSFTHLGMALTVIAVLAYLRWKRLPILAVMDAWAPCAALLAAAICFGHLVEGTDAGMPWGRHGTLVPVQVLGSVIALLLACILLRTVFSHNRAGLVAGVALVAGGLVAFALDLVSIPVNATSSSWLETGQWIALGAMIVGVAIFLSAKERV